MIRTHYMSVKIVQKKTPWCSQTVWLKAPNILQIAFLRNYIHHSTKSNIRISHSTYPPKTLVYKLHKKNKDSKAYIGAVREQKYILCALVFHSTDSNADALSKGHYYIDVMDWLSGRWFRCNNDVIEYLQPLNEYTEAEQSDIIRMVYVRKEYFKSCGIKSIYEELRFAMAKNSEYATKNLESYHGENKI